MHNGELPLKKNVDTIIIHFEVFYYVHASNAGRGMWMNSAQLNMAPTLEFLLEIILVKAEHMKIQMHVAEQIREPIKD